jgi:predicted outer membrane repeat protein
VYNTGGPLSLTGCTLSNNSAEAGGAIYGGGPMTVSGCTFTGNFATGGEYSGGVGGAIYNVGTATTVTTKKGHTTTTTTTTNLTVSNSTFSGNYVLSWSGIPTYTYPPIAGPWTNGGGNTFA